MKHRASFPQYNGHPVPVYDTSHYITHCLSPFVFHCFDTVGWTYMKPVKIDPEMAHYVSGGR